MEIEGEDGSKTLLKEGFTRVLGRGLGFKSNDRTVSRRHVSLQLQSSAHTRVSFEVVGKNPIWVHNSTNGEIRVYRRFERGEMQNGGMFCLSANNPFWFTLKRTGLENRVDLENKLAESLQSSSGLTGIEELELESVDFSNIDPIKEFGFVVMGKEFDVHPKKMIRDIKDWNWFLEESGVESEDEQDVERKGKKVVTKKRKKGKGNDEDDEWVGESDEDKELIAKSRKVPKPKYSTRSKDRKKPVKDSKFSEKPRLEKTTRKNEKEIEEDDNDDDDKTLGGFIVDDDDAGQVESEDEDEEEEEDFDGEDE
ncbi:hypothetical protein LguiB_023299 [Lonicera macranthoides]